MKPFQEFLCFSRGERRGIVLLVACILLVFLIGRICRNHPVHRAPTPAEERVQAEALARFDSFTASMQAQAQETRRARDTYTARKSRSSILHPVPFDPNTADSATLHHMGLPAWMARNIVRYRQRGGRFRQAADFRKIHGLTEETYQTLLPYIRIASEGNDPIGNDTTPPPRLLQPPPTASYKYPAGTVIDLNRADTTELKKIPGIGSAIARMITAYRNRLGGFYRVEQLEEIHLDYRRLAPWFHIDPDDIRRMDLNRTGMEKLRAHPYINFYQALRIVEERRKTGTLHNLKTLSLYDEFTPADIERLEHYVRFE